MTPERIITAYAVTSGEKHDGKELGGLIRLTEEAGITVDAVVGDATYSERESKVISKEKNIKLVSKLSETVTHSPNKSSTKFLFNKDAGMYVCQAGHMSSTERSQERRKEMKRDHQL